MLNNLINHVPILGWLIWTNAWYRDQKLGTYILLDFHNLIHKLQIEEYRDSQVIKAFCSHLTIQASGFELWPVPLVVWFHISRGLYYVIQPFWLLPKK